MSSKVYLIGIQSLIFIPVILVSEVGRVTEDPRQFRVNTMTTNFDEMEDVKDMLTFQKQLRHQKETEMKRKRMRISAIR